MTFSSVLSSGTALAAFALAAPAMAALQLPAGMLRCLLSACTSAMRLVAQAVSLAQAQEQAQASSSM